MTLTILKNKPVYPQRINNYLIYSIHITKSLHSFILLYSTNNSLTFVLIKDLSSVFLHEIEKRRRQFPDNLSYAPFPSRFHTWITGNMRKGRDLRKGRKNSAWTNEAIILYDASFSLLAETSK